jgi:hypothetical protein
MMAGVVRYGYDWAKTRSQSQTDCTSEENGIPPLPSTQFLHGRNFFVLAWKKFNSELLACQWTFCANLVYFAQTLYILRKLVFLRKPIRFT